VLAQHHVTCEPFIFDVCLPSTTSPVDVGYAFLFSLSLSSTALDVDGGYPRADLFNQCLPSTRKFYDLAALQNIVPIK